MRLEKDIKERLEFEKGCTCKDLALIDALKWVLREDHTS